MYSLPSLVSILSPPSCTPSSSVHSPFLTSNECTISTHHHSSWYPVIDFISIKQVVVSLQILPSIMIHRQLCLPSLSPGDLTMGMLACSDVYIVGDRRKKLGKNVWVICLGPGGTSRTEMGIIIDPPLTSASSLRRTHFNLQLM